MEVLAALVVPLFAGLAVLWIGLNLGQATTTGHHDSHNDRPPVKRLTPTVLPNATPDLQHPQRACDQSDRQTQSGRGE